ncbi:hypothetical protein PIIN_04215 [Serendipita indica DSM 11827]|uniref:Uncharacterized protein n=1 Tax=Serendipita indica (strain DSM 11827) TaxID=1109443 RepID=G4TG41_SERID|nr:hypothetical protein PIIN_04215 [Serendipita indica DSM 11827]
MSIALPDEILLLIFKDPKIGISEYLSLCSSSKRLRRIVYPLLYQRVELVDKECHLFLRSIVNNPSLGLMVTYLFLAWDTYHQGKPVDSEALPRFIEVASNRLPAAIRAIAIAELSTGSESAEALLLLTLLPRLDELNLFPSARERPPFIDTHLFTIIKEGVMPTSLSAVYYSQDVTKPPFDLANLCAFFFQPSVKSIRANLETGKAVEGDSEPQISSITDPRFHEVQKFYGKSSVETIDLLECSLLGAEIEVLLRLPKALKSLRYDMAFPWSQRPDSAAPSPTYLQVLRNYIFQTFHLRTTSNSREQLVH